MEQFLFRKFKCQRQLYWVFWKIWVFWKSVSVLAGPYWKFWGLCFVWEWEENVLEQYLSSYKLENLISIVTRNLFGSLKYAMVWQINEYFSDRENCSIHFSRPMWTSKITICFIWRTHRYKYHSILKKMDHHDILRAPVEVILINAYPLIEKHNAFSFSPNMEYLCLLSVQRQTKKHVLF